MDQFFSAVKSFFSFLGKFSVVVIILLTFIVINKLYLIGKEMLYMQNQLYFIPIDQTLIQAVITNDTERETACLENVHVWSSQTVDNELCSSYCQVTDDQSVANMGLFFEEEIAEHNFTMAIYVYRKPVIPSGPYIISSSNFSSNLPITLIPKNFYDTLRSTSIPDMDNFDQRKDIAVVSDKCNRTSVWDKEVECVRSRALFSNYRVLVFNEGLVDEQMFEAYLTSVLVVEDKYFNLYVHPTSFLPYDDTTYPGLIAENYTVWRDLLQNRKKSTNMVTYRLDLMSVNNKNYICRVCNYYCTFF